ncbi:MAG TPA: SDR family NAD(P)-dependent oxidoreductase [Chloroflexota bacterium]|nr:SDR family NAD(P)-dependent oxidoreductase [Chloroflexota bacterium]
MQLTAGQVAVVTGGASGIGLGLGTRFAEAGLKVVLADVEQPALDNAVHSLKTRGYDVLGVGTDVSKAESVQELADTALQHFGAVHVLCNNAGVGGLFTIPLWETSLKDWQWTLGVNLWGVVHGVRTFVPLMLRQGADAYVVNTSSIGGLTPGSRIYGVTKHAVVALSEALYLNLRQAQARIGVSVLCPSTVRTNMPYAYRNRPPELLDEVNAPPPAAERRASERVYQRAVETGKDPLEAADMVLQAIRDDQFWILTEDSSNVDILRRADDVVQRRNPPVRPAFGG